MEKKKLHHVVADSIREIIFGLEDSLVSTLGAVTGIAVGAGSTYIVILAGLVLIASESTSMAAGSYLSSKADAETKRSTHKKVPVQIEHESPVRAGAVMWFFYFIGGFVPLGPYFFLSVEKALWPSIILTVISLYLVGVWSASYTKRPKMKSGLEMAGISIAAAIIGFIIGRLVSSYFGVDAI